MAKSADGKRGERRSPDDARTPVRPPTLQDVIEGAPPPPRNPNAYVEDQMRKRRKAPATPKTRGR